ncbi:MAG: phage tail tape measure protein, partial [Akkermansia sp.]|nr:phage tail tape measure protein [Akkermansia sp.]
MQELSTADFAMGMEAVLGLFGKLRNVVGQLGQMFSSCMREAAALEEVGTRLGVMLNDAAAGDALASSLQRMATNGIVPLQELEKAAAALTQSLSDPGEIANWVGVFANISAGSDITADRLAKMTARMQDMGKAELTELANAGIPIFTALAKVTGKTTEEIVKLSSQGKLSTSTLLEAFKELTAEGEKYHDLNATMSNTTGGSWDTLAASFAEIMAEVGESLNNEIRPILQWVSEILQEYKDALSVIIGLVMRIVAVWGGLKALAVAKQLWQCVAALTAMRSVATGVWGVFRSIGKVGWLLVITSAVEALTYLYDKFFGASGQAVMPQPVKTKPDDFIAQTREQEKREKEKRQRAALNAAAGVEDFNRILQEGGAPEDYDISEGRRQAAKREHEKAQKAAREKELEDLQRNEVNRVNKNQADAFKKELDAFEKLHDWQQTQILGRRFGALRIKNNHDFDVSKMRNVLD